MDFIATADPDFANAALDELRRFDSGLHLRRTLGPGVLLVATDQSERVFATAVAAEPPIFVRHLVPVHATLALTNTQEDVDRLTRLVQDARQIGRLEPGQAFSVQARFVSAEGPLPERPYSLFALKEAIVPVVERLTGARENVKEPEMVISLLLDEQTAYMGISSVSQNLSSWAGGMRRFARDPEQISRSEFKLLEALDVFGLVLPRSGPALDLGAAPGGWTRLLLAAGLEVTAVDPAELDVRVRDHPRLRHIRGRAQGFLDRARRRKERYRVILSDMRVDAPEAARLMAQAAPLLDPAGFALVTLKLPYGAPGVAPLEQLDQAIERLTRAYAEVRVRQLFHNRHEVTALLIP